MTFTRATSYFQNISVRPIITSLRNIHIISLDVFFSNIREKKFWLAILYYVVVPLGSMLGGFFIPVIQNGTGIALYQAQFSTTSMITGTFLSFFLGQILIALLTADQIAGDIERGTFTLFRSKPIYEFEVVFGKYFGMLYTLSILSVPVLIINYYTQMFRFGAFWPDAFIHSLDEIIAVAVILVVLLGAVIGLALLTSSVFSKSLHSIITTLLLLFLVDFFGNLLPSNSKYLSLSWYVDVIYPKIFYNLEPVKNSPDPLMLFFLLIGVNLLFLVVASIILRLRENP